MNLLRTSLAAVAVAWVTAPAAFAIPTATQTVYVGVNGQPTSLAGTAVGFSAPLSFFNPALYATPGNTVQLNDVKLQFLTQATTSGIITNNDTTSATFTFALLVNAKIASVAGVPAVIGATFGPGSSTPYSLSNQFFPSATYNNVPPGGQVSYPVSPTTLTSTSPIVTDTLASDLAAFTGTGVFLIGLSTSGQAVLGGPGNETPALVTKAGATFNLSYDYSLVPVAVPEPSTVVLLGIGLLGVCLVGSRKNG